MQIPRLHLKKQTHNNHYVDIKTIIVDNILYYLIAEQ